MSYFFLKLSGVGSCANPLVYFLPGLSKQMGEALQLWAPWEHLAPAFLQSWNEITSSCLGPWARYLVIFVSTPGAF